MGYCLISIPHKTSRFLKDLRHSVEKNLCFSSFFISLILGVIALFSSLIYVSCVFSECKI